MSNRPPLITRATAIGAAGGLATVAVTVGIAAEIAHKPQPATTSGTGTVTPGSSNRTSSGAQHRSTSDDLDPVEIEQAPAGGSHGS